MLSGAPGHRRIATGEELEVVEVCAAQAQTLFLLEEQEITSRQVITAFFADQRFANRHEHHQVGRLVQLLLERLKLPRRDVRGCVVRPEECLHFGIGVFRYPQLMRLVATGGPQRRLDLDQVLLARPLPEHAIGLPQLL